MIFPRFSALRDHKAKIINKKLRQRFVAMNMMNKCAKFHKDSPSDKKLHSISRVRLNFGDGRFCVQLSIKTLWKRATSVAHLTNFSFEFFMKLSQKMLLNVFYTMVQKSQKWPKTQIKGGPALRLLWGFSTSALFLAKLWLYWLCSHETWCHNSSEIGCYVLKLLLTWVTWIMLFLAIHSKPLSGKAKGFLVQKLDVKNSILFVRNMVGACILRFWAPDCFLWFYWSFWISMSIFWHSSDSQKTQGLDSLKYGACAHYVMVTKFQWKPFWLATQRDPENDWTATQTRVNYDVFAQAPIFNLEEP